MSAPGTVSREERAGSSEQALSSSLVPPNPPATGPVRRKRALPLEVVSAGMLARRVDVRPADVVFVKGILEASEGLGAIFAERGGELVLSAPLDRAADFEELLADLVAEVGARLDPEPAPVPAMPTGSP